ncbi:hypothetical protein [Qipengyuania sp. SM2507]
MLPKTASTGSLKLDVAQFTFVLGLLAMNILGILGLAVLFLMIIDDPVRAPFFTLWWIFAVYLGVKNYLLLRNWFLDRVRTRSLTRYGSHSALILLPCLFIPEVMQWLI